MEEEVYKCPYFIKHVPVRDRAQEIEKLRVSGTAVGQTDFTGFEAHFSPELLDMCEFELYDWMVSQLSGDGAAFMSRVRRAIAGVNHCIFKWFIALILARRMSGEMCTSLGNGFTNLMFILFACLVLCHMSFVDVRVEGDDGVFAGSGDLPTAAMFESLGCDIKIEQHSDVNVASFCGLIYDPHDLIVVTDPRPVLADFGHVHYDYRFASSETLLVLLRCKGLSMLHQYPGCPIIQSLGLCILKVTKGVDPRNYIYNSSTLSMWERDQLREAYEQNLPTKPVPHRTRELVEMMFELPINVQIEIEQYLDSVDTPCVLHIPHADIVFKQIWRDYSSKYQRLLLVDDDLCDIEEVNTVTFLDGRVWPIHSKLQNK